MWSKALQSNRADNKRPPYRLSIFSQKLRASTPRERLQKILNSKRRHPIQEICRVKMMVMIMKLKIGFLITLC